MRKIARRTGLSRNTVRKYLASGELEPRYKRPKSPSKLDDYEQTLTSWLHCETKRLRKQRRTAKHLHQDLVLLGYAGSYDRVAQPLLDCGSAAMAWIHKPLSRCSFHLGKPFSSIGANIT